MTAIADLPDIRPSLLLDFANSGRVDPRIQCTRASSATCFGPDGKLRTVAANVPRIDYDPVTGKCLGLLVEEARTNLWLNSATAVAQSFAVTAQTYTLSFEGSGSIALTGAYSGDSSAGTVQSGRRVLTFTPSAGSLTCTPSGDVRNVQLEVGAFPTSYIPTEASAVTRAADTAQLQGAQAVGQWLNASQGTLLARSRAFQSKRKQTTIAALTDGSSANRVMLRGDTSVSQGVGGFVVANSVDLLPPGYTPLQPTTGVSVAVSYATNSAAISAYGDILGTSFSGQHPQGIDRLVLGNAPNTGGTEHFNGHISLVAYYPVRITNEQLQRLTA